MASLRERLKELRGTASFYEVGQATGINRGDIKRIEEGQLRPSRSNLRKFAEFFKVPYEELLLLYVQELFDADELAILVQWAREQG